MTSGVSDLLQYQVDFMIMRSLTVEALGNMVMNHSLGRFISHFFKVTTQKRSWSLHG